MINLSNIVGFDWDEGNARKSQNKHNVSRLEAEQVFFNIPMLMLVDEKHSSVEKRWHALGKTDRGRLLRISFTLRENQSLIRVISARDIRRKERACYEQA